MLNDITEIFLVYKVRDRYNEKKTLQEEKNMKYKALLFDLDGTLTASGEGITNLYSMLWKKWEWEIKLRI